jgi:predicted GNAT family acetyltransferase
MPDELVNNAELHRYELRIDGEVAGVVEYRFAGEGRIVLIHTEVDERFEGHGLGGRLAQGVLDDARAHGWQVVPRCPFIADYIRSHPDYADLTQSKA